MRIFHRKAALVVLQSRDQHFARQFEKAGIEAARDAHRPFHERRHLVEELGFKDRPSAEFTRLRRREQTDFLAPLREIRDHVTAGAQEARVASR